MRLRLWVAASAVAVMLPSLSPAQSLGEAAAREREKREKRAAKPATTKVITEEDLRRGRVGGTGVSEFTTGGTTAAAGEAKPGDAKAAAPAATGADKAKSEEEQRAAQADWRERMNAAQADVTRMQSEITKIETALADNTAAQYSPVRVSNAARLEEARKLLVEAQARVTTLQNEGRQSGF
jgi:hypothetical protein